MRKHNANLVLNNYSNVAEKNILILVEEKKNLIQSFLSYNLMLNFAKIFRALPAKKNKYSNSYEKTQC
jgi:hypothetical protein